MSRRKQGNPQHLSQREITPEADHVEAVLDVPEMPPNSHPHPHPHPHFPNQDLTATRCSTRTLTRSLCRCRTPSIMPCWTPRCAALCPRAWATTTCSPAASAK
ncbi:hypothetical protein AALO_G00241230 [Alosa alosa]|uniref:Uncharacterized protein n=1 Tax=Alosa alosa TaxID=278164 RepID=A0AAV6FV77_9TELE|nr:hypothetical protein AALO_G00241230 [Alosa alosa]